VLTSSLFIYNTASAKAGRHLSYVAGGRMILSAVKKTGHQVESGGRYAVMHSKIRIRTGADDSFRQVFIHAKAGINKITPHRWKKHYF
ncbi:hypothetical protein D4R52_00640, partial [bacterium]